MDSRVRIQLSPSLMDHKKNTVELNTCFRFIQIKNRNIYNYSHSILSFNGFPQCLLYNSPSITSRVNYDIRVITNASEFIKLNHSLIWTEKGIIAVCWRRKLFNFRIHNLDSISWFECDMIWAKSRIMEEEL